MPNSPRIHFPYPDETSRPWDASFAAMVNALDAALYANREDRNFAMAGGGLMAFTASTGLLTWAANIEVFSPITGFLIQIAPGSVVLQDGQIAYITIVRNPQKSITALMTVGNVVPNEPSGDDQFLIGWRRGSVVHFRDGLVLADGENRNVFDESALGGVVVEASGVPIVGNPHTIFDFTGPGVAVTDAGGGKVTVTVTGVGGVDVQEEGIALANNPHSILNFVGSGVTAVDAGGGVAQITVSASMALAGDVVGTTAASVVSAISGAVIGTPAGALVTGHVLRVTGASAADWGALDLSNASATTGSLAGTKVAPNFGAQNIQSTGTLQIGSTTTLSALGGSGSGLVAVSNTGVLSFEPFSALAGSITLAGDVSGLANSNTVDKWKGKTLDAATMGAPTDAQVPVWVNGSSAWKSLSVGGDATLSSTASLTLLSAFGSVSLEKFGAVGDGVTNDSAAMTAAIAWLGANGGAIVLRANKTYLIGAGGPYILPAGTGIIGAGDSSVLATATNATLIQIGGQGTLCDRFKISATGSGGAQIGISVGPFGVSGGYPKTIISYISVEGCGYTGIFVAPHTTDVYQHGVLIHGCRVSGGNYGIWLHGEYNRVSASDVWLNTTGIYIPGGNNIVVGSTISNNTTGMHIVGGGNDGHGSVGNCDINHNVTNLRADNIVANGMPFTNCNFYGVTTSINLISSTGIRFIGCAIDVSDLYFDGSVGTQFQNCLWPMSSANTFHHNYNAHPSKTIFGEGNVTLDGLGSQLAYTFPADANQTLTPGQSVKKVVVVAAGVISTGRTITSALDASVGQRVLVRNNNAQAVTWAWASGAGVLIPAGTALWVGSDGTNAIPLANDAASILLAGDVTGPGNANTLISALGSVSLEKFGAVGDGVTNDAAAYTAALASGNTILLGSRNYLTTAGYTGSLAAKQSLVGVGGQSTITNLSNQPIVTVGGDGSLISDVRLVGTFGAGASNHGISSAYSQTIINNVWVDTPGKHGIYLGPTNSVANYGATVSNVRVYVPVNGAGVCVDGMQYATITAAHGYGGTYGVYIDAGNTIVSGSHFDLNTYGLYINNTRGNDGHGVFQGGTLNHSVTEAVHIEPLLNGFDIRDSEIYYSDIRVIGGSGGGYPSLVRFKDCDIDVANWQLDGALVEVDGCKIAAANANTVNLAVNAHASTLIVRPNIMKVDGTTFDFTVNTRWDTPANRQHEHRFDGVVKHSIDGAHGVGTFGGGGSDTAAHLGPLTGFETVNSALWLLLNGVSRTAANPAVYTDGANTILNSPQAAGLGSIYFYAAGSAAMAKMDPVAPLFTSYQPFAVAVTGQARAELRPYTGNTADMALYLGGNALTPNGTNYAVLSDGTSVWFNTPGAGLMKFFNQNATQLGEVDTTGWSFFTSRGAGQGPVVEAAHGHIVSGGVSGTEWKTHIGPYPGFETADSAIWFLAPGTARTSANMAMYGNGNNTIINIPLAAQFAGIYGGGDGYYHFQIDTTSTRFMRAGPYTSAYIEHTGHGHMVAGGGNGDWKVHIGPYTGFETSYGAMWSLAPATARSSSNMLFYSDGSSVYFNVPVTGNILGFVDAAANNIVLATKTYWNHYTLVGFAPAATATIYQINATAGSGATFTIQAQNAFPTGGGNGGTLKLQSGAKDGAGTDGPVQLYSGANKILEASYTGGVAIAAVTTVLTVGATPASVGDIRIRNTAAIYARNNANTNDVLTLYKDADDFVGVGDTAQAAGIYLNAKSSGVVRLQTVPTFEFSKSISGVYIQQESNAGATTAMTIRAQASTSGNNNGGTLYVQGGAGNGSGNGGDLHLAPGAGGGSGVPGLVYVDVDISLFGAATNRQVTSRVAKLETSNGTTTTADTFTMSDGEAGYDFAVTVTAKDNATGGYYRQDHRVSYTRTGSGAPAIQGTLITSNTVATGSIAAATSTLDVSSNDLRVRVTGIAGTTVEWTSTMTVQFCK